MSLDEINDLVEKSTGKGIFDDLVIDTDDGFYKTVPDYLSNMYKESTPSEKTELKNTIHANTFLNEDSNINPPTKNVDTENNNISKILSDTNNKIPYEIASEFLKLQNINISKEVWDKYLPIRQHDLISRLRKSNPNCE